MVTRLLLCPPRNALLNLFQGLSTAFRDVLPPSINRLTNVDSVLDVLKQRVIRQRIQDAANFIFGGLYGNSYTPVFYPKE